MATSSAATLVAGLVPAEPAPPLPEPPELLELLLEVLERPVDASDVSDAAAVPDGLTGADPFAAPDGAVDV
jgi:hypothetical protein